ncbi:DHA2 family efflux MFS transporter permease subunit [Agrobacterium sp. B1(2019)]|uniref:DHA2 family efflux MFS transporter permease subunit n=1 Tax=Agrobacterium sp. B1(2019) TaxID=2607032 RepID=UPI001FEFCF2C|nr:DHA2 family efflux MFS transporter permease subunit [Agrobacterium sp. B1(2019)]
MTVQVINPRLVATLQDSRNTAPAILFVAGVVLAALMEAVAGTVLSTARLDIIGDTYATSDELARLDVGYTAAKLVAYILAPWFMSRFSPLGCLRAATGTMTVVCGAAAITSDLNVLTVLRLLQGAAGGMLLVSGQTMLFLMFPRSHQPIVQCIFAIGAVVAPATLTPYMQGWLVDSLSWSWIFLCIVPIGMGALILLAFTKESLDERTSVGKFDWLGAVLFTGAAFCLTYVLNQGSRWDWFEEPMIAHLLIAGSFALLLFLAYQFNTKKFDTVLDLTIFRNSGFAFGFIASFAAGFALFGSAYLIPTFAVSIIGMTPTEAGILLLPSTLMFIATLLLTTFLVQRRGLPPIVTVPFGILCFIAAMCMLSGVNGDSGFPDLMPAILLRGLALGFLFLSITLITLPDLEEQQMAYGVGFFNVGRQTGGLLGVAALQTLLDHQTALNKIVLVTYIVPGRVAVSDRIALLTNSFTSRGLDASAAAEAAVQTLGREVTRQASIVAFDTAFLAVALFFVVAAPVLITSKIVIGKVLNPGSRKFSDHVEEGTCLSLEKLQTRPASSGRSVSVRGRSEISTDHSVRDLTTASRTGDR